MLNCFLQKRWENKYRKHSSQKGLRTGGLPVPFSIEEVPSHKIILKQLLTFIQKYDTIYT